ncbi:MAG: thiamine-phosphate kinase [Acidothermus sp.]|nr:thiamine-phosphate kinase [Acidothermus sp.]
MSDLGEFGLIARIIARTKANTVTLLGPGDDAAVVAAGDGRVVATTDLLVEGRHFRRDWSTPYDVGRKAAAQNMADVAAMGAVPTALLVGFGAPPELAAFWAERLMDGLVDEAAAIGAAVIGGDVVRAESIVVAVTALGDLQGRTPVTRSGARPGDVVALCGRLGWAEAGVAALRHGFRTPRAVVEAHRRPQPPYQAGPRAADAGATAMIDVSDGLLADVGHIASASKVRIDLSREALPVDPPVAEVGAALGIDPLRWVLTGGEDHALVATFPPTAPLPSGWRPIGKVTAAATDGEVLVDGDPYDGTGFDHFAG